jgi:hypothetical protein
MTILKGNGKETAMRRHGISTVHTEWKVTQSFVAQNHWCYSVEPFRVEGGELTMAIKYPFTMLTEFNPHFTLWLSSHADKMTALWDIALCSLDTGKCFRGAHYLHHQGNNGGSIHL